MTIIKNGMDKKMINLETVEAVHTHTHTHTHNIVLLNGYKIERIIQKQE